MKTTSRLMVSKNGLFTRTINNFVLFLSRNHLFFCLVFFYIQYLHTTLVNVTDRNALNLANAGIIGADDAASVNLDTTAVGFSVYLMVMPL